MADPVHQLRRRAHHPLHLAILRDRAKQGFDAGDVGRVVSKARTVNVGNGGEVRDRLRPHRVDGALNRVGP